VGGAGGLRSPSGRARTLKCVIPEEDKPRGRSPQESELDVLAERRARRAWLGNSALARRAEAAEATVSTLETHLADLRCRQVEVEHEREIATAQLAERDRELRRVKQREHAEQQLRVEAEEASVLLRRDHRLELDRLQRRAEEAHAAAEHAEEQRAALAARLAGVSESCIRLERGVAALQGAAVELRAALDRDHEAARARIAELERELAARSPRPAAGSNSKEPVHREEMAGALAAAVERLRARAVPALEGLASEDHDPQTHAPETESPKAPAPVVTAPPQEVPTVIVVPRLFSGTGWRAERLRPVARRIATRLAEWADRGPR
jgi:hypothetical protein